MGGSCIWICTAVEVSKRKWGHKWEERQPGIDGQDNMQTASSTGPPRSRWKFHALALYSYCRVHSTIPGKEVRCPVKKKKRRRGFWCPNYIVDHPNTVTLCSLSLSLSQPFPSVLHSCSISSLTALLAV